MEIIKLLLLSNLIKYLLISGLLFLIFYVLLRKKNINRKIQKKWPNSKDYYRELGYSLSTMIIFSLIGFIIFGTELRNYTLEYKKIATYSSLYWLLSVLLMVLLHDAYFYWTHRLMHYWSFLRKYHMKHHESINPSPLAAFSFHPIEAIIEASIIFVIVFTIPFHISAIGAFLLIMTMFNAYGHLGFELFPNWMNKNVFGKWMNTGLGHNIHHKEFKNHYGLYFMFWDRFLSSMVDDYDERFDNLTKKN